MDRRWDGKIRLWLTGYSLPLAGMISPQVGLVLSWDMPAGRFQVNRPLAITYFDTQ
jgi:hypothetical protein